MLTGLASSEGDFSGTINMVMVTKTSTGLQFARPFLVWFESAEIVYLFDFRQMRRREPDRFARDLL